MREMQIIDKTVHMPCPHQPLTACFSAYPDEPVTALLISKTARSLDFDSMYRFLDASSEGSLSLISFIHT
jgi:hypothetical protein